MKKNKDTYSTWPQYSMGTKLCKPEDQEEVWGALYESQLGGFLNGTHRMWSIGFHSMMNPDQVMNTEDICPPHWKLQPVWGKIPEDQFWYFLSRGLFPVNQQLRHKDATEYVFLRDKFHDTFGHVPALYNKEYSDVMISMGILGQLLKGNEEALTALSRFYWATIEFSLMVADDLPFLGTGVKYTKALGAGIISSKEELELAISNSENTQREFNFQEIIEWDYDPYGIQDRHYVIEDWRQVTEGIVQFYKKYL